MLVSQSIDNLLNGVSQQPSALRLASQAEEQVNGLSRFADGGPSKRPGTSHVAKLTSDTTGADSAFVHPINMGEGNQYFVVIANGELRVYDKRTGTTIPVLFPHGQTYIVPVDLLPSSFLLDLFTDENATELSAHESDSQHTWTSLNANPEATIQSNRVRVNVVQSGASLYRLSYEAPTADYTVSARVLHDSNTSEDSEVYARIPLSAVGGYGCRLTSASGAATMELYRKESNGSETLIDDYTHSSAVADTEQTIAIRVTGTTIEGLLNGTVVMTGTDSTYTAAGNPGLGGVQGALGQGADVYIDDFTVAWTIATETPVETYRAVTVGNRTFLTNTSVQVLQDTTRKAPVQTPQALIYLEQADFSTTYSVTIDGVTVSYETPAGTEASARSEIDTSAITNKLLTLLDAAFTSFTFHQFGSMIRVKRDDDADFTIAATDGLSDNGILVIKSTVQRTTDLPLRCVDGYVLEVVGGPEEAKDTYWVEFDSQGSDDFRGVWKECVRPGEGVAFDPATLPHELIYSSEITERMEARGFPSQPVITAANPVKAAHAWQGTQDGATNDTQFIFMKDHGSDTFINLTEANGGPLTLEIRYLANTTKLADGETFFLTLAINDNATPSSGTFVDVAQRAYAKGVYKSEVWIVEIGTNVPANYDIRLTVTYSGGSTPADGERGSIVLLPYDNDEPGIPGFQYTRYSGRDVTWPTDTVYPKGTAWNIDVGGSDANYTQTTDMTGAAIAAALEPIVEALTGVDSTLVTNDRGTAIRITLAAGGLPTVTATGTFSSSTRFWNPDIDLGFDGAELDGKILKNLSDGSEGVITDCYATGITVSSMTGGVDNVIRNGDLCVVTDTSERFTFRQIRWTDRAAGDSVTNPWPSIRDGYVRDVFYTRGRLGLLSGGNIVLSEAGKPENLFRTATTDLLDSDPIDTKPATSGSANFHSAVDWDGRFLMWTDTAQFELQGEPLLTPATVALPQLTKFDSSPVRPLVVGSRIYFARGMSTSTRMFEYRLRQSNERPDATEITRDLPSYLAGYPTMIVGDTALGFVAVLTDDDPTHLYTYSAHYEDSEQYQSAWSRWEFAADSTIVGMDFVDGTLGILFSRSDGIYLELLDLDDSGLLLDRRLDAQTGTYASNKTTWDLPYSIPTDGSEGTVVVVVNGAVVATTRGSATTVETTADVNLSASSATIGVRYDFRYTLSTLHPRSREGKADTRGRLQLSRALLRYKDSREFDVEVTPTGRAKRTYSFAETSAQDGEFPFQIGTRNTTALIEFVNDSPFQCILTGLDWEGTLVNRSRRI
jgi:uncharacterized protein YcnI